ncbi:MAG: translation elongation factor-like protein [Elusimicrobia bacterium]|nr:translation elongation factor-like protein [Elusimicrobiota bacterium]
MFLGKVLDYYSKARVITLTLEAPLAVGDTIRIKGHTTDLTQKVEHMQLDHSSVHSASPGEGVGIQVADKARKGDAVYKL